MRAQGLTKGGFSGAGTVGRGEPWFWLAPWLLRIVVRRGCGNQRVASGRGRQAVLSAQHRVFVTEGQ